MPPLTMASGGFATGNILANGDFELRALSAVKWYSRFWAETITLDGLWRNSVVQAYSGSRSQELLFNAALQTAGRSARIDQQFGLQPGIQADQCALNWRLTAACRLPSALAGKVQVLYYLGYVLDDGTADATRVMFQHTPTLLPDGWSVLQTWFAPADFLTPAQMAQLAALTFRVFVYVPGNFTPATPASIYFDGLRLDAEMANTKQVCHPEDMSRAPSAFRTERLADTSAKLVWRSVSGGTQKRRGTLNFSLITKAQRDKLAAIYGLKDRGGVRWYPMLPGYPDWIDLQFTGPFAFNATSPSLAGLYSGALDWEEI